MGRTSSSRSSTSRTGSGPIPIGRVAGAHGLAGQLRVRPLGDVELSEGVRVTLSGPDGAAVVRRVRRVRPGRSGEWRVTLEGVEDREAAEALRGFELGVAPGDLPKLAEGEVYAHELIGCRLETRDGAPLGRVRGIWETGAPDVLVVDGEDGRERLVSAAWLVRVEPEAGRAVIELPPGALEDA